MSDELKNEYRVANKMDRYFDFSTPCELLRGVQKGTKVALMQPTLAGWYKRKPDPDNPKVFIPDPTKPRNPDVLVINKKTGRSPQYAGGTAKGELRVESKEEMEITQEMVRNADDYMVRGCRTMSGVHRGLSLANGVNPSLPFDWFVIDANTRIPPGLAVTRDADVHVKGVVHYTVAPKDDMTLALYLVQLNTLGMDAVALR